MGVAFILWVRLLKTNSPGLLSVFVFPTPLFGVLFSALIYRESPTVELVVGVAGVALGILLVTLENREQVREPETESRPQLGRAA